ncbi:MAG TPA: nucleotide-binding protein [Thermoanaerobaculia bacterium]|nr:nucleotide-binding protein [Thermoanaerobaculia bacterium]
MKKFKDGEWDVFEEKTRKSFGRFKVDASRGLLQGLSGLTTSFSWRGNTCHIRSPGAEGTLTYEAGVVQCRVRLSWYLVWGVRSKILSDIENTTIDVCGPVDPANKTVFVVHGHSPVHRSELQGLLAGLGLQPVVLDEQDDLGMTIIEKLEYYAKICAYAVVLMTADDLAAAAGSAASQGRARQNVVLELGWFMAYLGRDRVLLLYSGEVEIPSDILGVVYLRFKDSVREVEHKIQQRLRGVGMIA